MCIACIAQVDAVMCYVLLSNLEKRRNKSLRCFSGQPAGSHSHVRFFLFVGIPSCKLSMLVNKC